MMIIPAIDLKEGSCVRLRQGDMQQSTIFSKNPVEQALEWQKQGAKRLHIVDLDGSFAGGTTHFDIISSITAELDIDIEIGGGIRTLSSIEKYLEAGAKYTIIGTQALEEKDFVRQTVKNFAEAIIVGIDARGGKVATHGWQDVSQISCFDFVDHCVQSGCKQIVYTDIDKDGMMQGPNIESTVAIAQRSGVKVIASGGVSSLQNIKDLIDTQQKNIVGAIVGRALYDKAFSLAEAQNIYAN